MEFAVNNSLHEATRNTPLYLNYGQHPLTPATMEIPEDAQIPAAADIARRIAKAVKDAKAAMRAAQQRMVVRANEHRRDVQFHVGQLVMLNTANLNRDKQGVRPKWVGPFEIVQLHGPVSVELDLPASWKRVHRVFTARYVKPYRVAPGIWHQAWP